jgi:hypothetical protein
VAGQWAELVVLVMRVAGELGDRAARVSLRRTAANVSATHLVDKARARQLWGKVLEDGVDREALDRLIDDAIQEGDEAEATKWIERLDASALEGAKEAAEALRAALRAAAVEPEGDCRTEPEVPVAQPIAPTPEQTAAPDETAAAQATEPIETKDESDAGAATAATEGADATTADATGADATDAFEVVNAANAADAAEAVDETEATEVEPEPVEAADDVIIADDMAELLYDAALPDIPIDVALPEGMAPPPPDPPAHERERKAKKKRKRSVPPPLPL